MEIEKDSIKIEFIPEKIVFGDYKDLKRRIPNLDKAKEILGYEPKVKLKDAIKMVIGSMKSNN